jgi:hypothetical protein
MSINKSHIASEITNQDNRKKSAYYKESVSSKYVNTIKRTSANTAVSKYW